MAALDAIEECRQGNDGLAGADVNPAGAGAWGWGSARSAAIVSMEVRWAVVSSKGKLLDEG